MKVHDLVINGTPIQGIEIPLEHAPLILAVARRGYIMCGYLDIKTAEQKNDCAAIVRGVSTLEEMLEGRISNLTTRAEQAGISTDMTGYQALLLML